MVQGGAGCCTTVERLEARRSSKPIIDGRAPNVRDLPNQHGARSLSMISGLLWSHLCLTPGAAPARPTTAPPRPTRPVTRPDGRRRRPSDPRVRLGPRSYLRYWGGQMYVEDERRVVGLVVDLVRVRVVVRLRERVQSEGLGLGLGLDVGLKLTVQVDALAKVVTPLVVAP